jgi:predicted N-acetyltransferase YhbS
MPLIRGEIPANYDAVRELNRTAFEGEFEAQLVDRLRNDGAVVVPLVAVEEDNIAGHMAKRLPSTLLRRRSSLRFIFGSAP